MGLLSSEEQNFKSSPLSSSNGRLNLPSISLASTPFQTNLERQRTLASKLIEDYEYKIQEIDRLLNSKSEENISEKTYHSVLENSRTKYARTTL